MNPRLTRPLLTFAVSGALVAGGGLVAGPASANPGNPSPMSPEAASLLDDSAPVVASADPAPDAASAPPAATQVAPAPEPVPDPADTAPPVGTFSLNSPALWIGQSVSLTQGAVTDDVSTPEQIIRIADWGDGTSTELAAGTAKYVHKYSANGTFTVKVTYQDASGKTSEVTSPVSVTTPGKVKLSKTSLWNGERLSVAFSSVPAGTTKIVLDWGDGYTSSRTRARTSRSAGCTTTTRRVA